MAIAGTAHERRGRIFSLSRLIESTIQRIEKAEREIADLDDAIRNCQRDLPSRLALKKYYAKIQIANLEAKKKEREKFKRGLEFKLKMLMLLAALMDSSA